MKKSFIFLFVFSLFLIFPICKIDALTLKEYATDTPNTEIDSFNSETNVISVFNFKSKDIYITDKDVYLMAQIVYAESRSEPYEGKVAVASVILNRVKHPRFPKTIEDVIKQKSAFSCVRNGQINVVPDESSYRAVLDALKGSDPTEKAVFFYNPKIATSPWMKNINKHNVKTIGNHVFFDVSGY